MHEFSVGADLPKAQRYAELLPQIRAMLDPEPELLPAALGNVCAVLKEQFDWLWVGFYLVNAEQNELLLAPFQGPPACTRIAKGRGVCGQAWAQAQTMLVADVSVHPDHIACSARSRSEIVVPLYRRNGEIAGVLDVDAESVGAFDATDAEWLQKLCAVLTETLPL